MECHSFRLSNGLCSFSPNGLYTAVVNQQRLTTYLMANFTQHRVFQCIEIIEFIEWSSDSELILSAYPSKGKLEVWSINQPEWRCKINTGSYGLLSAQFSPGSRHILTISNLYLRLTIWSLSDKTVSHINLPKEASPGIDFSVGGTYMAVAERRSARDTVAIYSCDSWAQITVIDTETIDLGGLKWCPDGSKLAIWDGIHSGQLNIYSLSGSKVGFTADSTLLGVHNIEWSPSAQLLAIATAGSKVKLINHLSWQPISTLSHPCKIFESNTCVIYRESDCHMQYSVVTDRPFVPMRGDVPSGRIEMTFSSDARYLAVVDQSRPKMVWIWDIPRLELKTLLVQSASVTSFKWSGTEPRLAIVCATSFVYFWTPLGAAVMNLSSLKADRLEWSTDGQDLIASSKVAGCVCKIK